MVEGVPQDLYLPARIVGLDHARAVRGHPDIPLAEGGRERARVQGVRLFVPCLQGAPDVEHPVAAGGVDLLEVAADRAERARERLDGGDGTARRHRVLHQAGPTEVVPGVRIDRVKRRVGVARIDARADRRARRRVDEVDRSPKIRVVRKPGPVSIPESIPGVEQGVAGPGIGVAQASDRAAEDGVDVALAHRQEARLIGPERPIGRVIGIRTRGRRRHDRELGRRDRRQQRHQGRDHEGPRPRPESPAQPRAGPDRSPATSGADPCPTRSRPC